MRQHHATLCFKGWCLYCQARSRQNDISTNDPCKHGKAFGTRKYFVSSWNYGHGIVECQGSCRASQEIKQAFCVILRERDGGDGMLYERIILTVQGSDIEKASIEEWMEYMVKYRITQSMP